MTFAQLKVNLSDEQRQILSAIWQHYLDKNKWILTRVLHLKFGKTATLAALNNLGGTIVYEVFDSGEYRYQLMFLGLLLTDSGSEIESLLARYLECLKERYQADPEKATIKSHEVAELLDLNADEVFHL